MIDDDHRNLGQRLDLFHFQDEAPGMAFWHPNGNFMYRLLEQLAREELDAAGYAEVRTPQILRRPVWEASGHWQHFAEGMFRVHDQKADAAIKPVSCPGHVYIADRRQPSYRDLPIRLAEFGVVHRDEPSGTLQGLLRLRQFTQDDGHVFCTFEQALDEVERFCRSVPPFYARFGFDALELSFATRPADRAGDDALWDRAEASLAEVLKRLDWPHAVQPGGGAFYGPKLEFVLKDRLGRRWQCGTIQFDLVMPERFDLGFVDRDGGRRRCVMLHRALYGSLEPRGRRASVDDRNESLSRRMVDRHQALVPFVAVVGDKEIAERKVTLRAKDEQRSLDLDVALAELAATCAIPVRAAGGSAVVAAAGG